MIDRALRLSGSDPYRNLALEESLLERGIGGGSALLLYVNDPCVVVGRNQNPWAEASEGSGLPILRRVSGGGAVYHDRGNLNWSFVVPRRGHDREAELDLVMGALRGLGLELEADSRGGIFTSGGSPRSSAKIAGTARRISAERVLHHGTLLVDADLERMNLALGGLAADSTRSLPSAPSPCVNVSSLLSGIGVEAIALAIAGSLVGSPIEPAEAYADRSYADQAEARLRGWDWTWGATPPFAVAAEWKGGRILIELRGGRVASVSGPGSEAISDFVGRPFDYGLPKACVDAMNYR